MNELTKLIQGEAPLVFVDDIVLADKTRLEAELMPI